MAYYHEEEEEDDETGYANSIVSILQKQRRFGRPGYAGKVIFSSMKTGPKICVADKAHQTVTFHGFNSLISVMCPCK